MHTKVGHPLDVNDVVDSVTTTDGKTYDNPSASNPVNGLSWKDLDPTIFDKPDTYTATIQYFDSNSFETVTKDITIYVDAEYTVSGSDTTYTVGDDHLTTDDLKPVVNDGVEDIDTDASDFSSNIETAVNWNKPGEYTVEINWKTPDGNEVTGEVVVTVVSLAELGANDSYTTPQGVPPTLDDLGAYAKNGHGDADNSGIWSEDLNKINWNTPGTYTVVLHYTDPLTKQEFTKTVQVTVDDSLNSISAS